MTWQIKFTTKAKKELDRLDATNKTRILKFLKERVEPLKNAREIGEALEGALSHYWKYRTGNYRIICKIIDKTITVEIIKIGHRSEVYR